MVVLVADDWSHMLATPLSDHSLLWPRPSGHTSPTVVHEMLSLSICSRSKVQNYDLRWEFGPQKFGEL